MTKEKPSKKYKIFAVIFTLMAAVGTIYLLLWGLSPDRYVPSINPYYTEGVNYPPAGTEKIGAAVFALLLSLFFLWDSFWAYKISGRKRFIFSLVWTILTLLIIEAAMGVYVKKNPPLHRPNPVWLWELFPGQKGITNVGGAVKSIQVNRFGFRGDDFDKTKRQDVFRIMILGDSSAFGYGMNQHETFAEELQRLLKKKYPSLNIQVINGAVPGYTTYASKEFFLKKGIKFEPDVIIAAHNNDPNLDWDEDKNRAPSPVIAPLLTVLYRSGIYMAVRRQVLNYKYNKSAHFYKAPSEDYGVRRVNEKDYKENFETILNTAKSKGIKTMVVSMPLMEDEDPVLLRYRQIMKETALENGGEFVDIFSKWQRFDAENLFLDDVHPNEAGHMVIAQTLAEALVNTGWISRKKGR